MKRVTGLGGIFFKAKDPQRLRQWYEHHLGLKPAHEAENSVTFRWREPEDPTQEGMTVWALF